MLAERTSALESLSDVRRAVADYGGREMNYKNCSEASIVIPALMGKIKTAIELMRSARGLFDLGMINNANTASRSLSSLGSDFSNFARYLGHFVTSSTGVIDALRVEQYTSAITKHAQTVDNKLAFIDQLL